MSATTEELWDVVVVGGGPGGSTLAAYLADAGRKVLVVDRYEFPRLRIGESLLPVCLPVLEELGIEPDTNFYLVKRGAEFVCEQTNRRAVFDFNDALPGPPRYAWHVNRPAFDLQIKQRAEAGGATFRHGVTVTGVEFHGDRVAIRTKEAGSLAARYLVDASGQNRLLARHHSSASTIDSFGKTAAFMHYEGVSDEALKEIGEGNDIRILITPHGWGWAIPLPNRRLSVGLVSKGEEPASRLLEAYIRDSRLVQSWTQGCAATEVRLERNFSYRNTAPVGSRYACVGDAACFLDPVFSSGVALAMVGAQSIARHLVPALETTREADADLMQPHVDFMEAGIQAFASMIDRFYNTRFIENFIFGPEAGGQIQREIVSVLAGDVWRDDNSFQKMLMRSRRSAPTRQAPGAIS